MTVGGWATAAAAAAATAAATMSDTDKVTLQLYLDVRQFGTRLGALCGARRVAALAALEALVADGRALDDALLAAEPTARA